jgi:hypothetical protein
MDFIDNNLDELNKNLQKYIFNRKKKDTNKSTYPDNTILEHADGGSGDGNPSGSSSSSCCSSICCILVMLGMLFLVNMSKGHRGGYLVLND